LAFSTITTGYYHTCGLTTAGSAYCWGYNAYGQLGDGSTVPDSPLRVAVAGGLTFSTGALSAGRYHTCGRVGAQAWCWGNGGNGELGNGARVNRNQPVQIVQ
jgi:alpha-tubulin suppressor-like RCC1 family protein